MSNQNFDTNSPFSSSSQPVPIATQLGTQAYLSQVQDQRDGLAKDEEGEGSRELKDRFASPPAPEDQAPPAVNKMDSFFRQAEEDERQRILESQNPALQMPVQTVKSDVSEIPPSDPHQAYAVPVVELPEVESPEVELPEVELPEVELPAALTQAPEMLAPQQTDDESFVSGQPQADSGFVKSFTQDQFQEKNPQYSGQQYSSDQLAAPSDGEIQPMPQQAPPEAESQPAHEPEPQSKAPESTPPIASRRLTGTAGLSAALATAGIGALGATLASQTGSDNNAEVQTPPNLQPLAIPDPSGGRRQQIEGEQPKAQLAGEDAGFPTDEQTVNVDPAPRDASESSSSPLAQTHAGVSLAGNFQPPTGQQNVSAEGPPLQNPSASSPQVSPGVTGGFVTSGFSGGFNPVGTPPASPAADHQSESVSSQLGALQPASSQFAGLPFDSSQSAPQAPSAPQVFGEPTSAGVPPAPPQSAAEPGQPSSSSDSQEKSDVEDARLAAFQQAQRIKAERAKALVDGPTAPARPYGATNLTPISGEPQKGVLAKVSAPHANHQQMAPPQNSMKLPVPLPQKSQEQIARLLVDEFNPDGSMQRRQFPMELFNQNLLKNLRSGVVFVDHQRQVKLWSKGAEKMTGIVSEAVIDRPLYPQTFNLRFEDGTDVTLEQCPIAQCLEKMENVSADYRMLNSANQEVKVEVMITPVIDEERCAHGAIIIFDDHSAEIDLQRQLKDLYEFSVLDPLTQVANRAEFERVLEEYVRAFNQSDSFNCSIIICDIDYFKSINDNFGHAVGDQALVAFAEMLRKYVRSQDLVARYGGEEFVILCADCDTNSALQRAEQVRMGLFKTQQKMLGGKSISASFGVSELRQGDTAMEFFVRADTALLRAKETGRNRVVIADQREVQRDVNLTHEGNLSGMEWRQQRREHTALLSEEFKTCTPVPVLVEKLRGFIIERDAWLQRVDQEFLSMEVDLEDPSDYSRKGSFTVNIEFKEGDDNDIGLSSKKTFIRISIFPGRKKKWFSTNHTDVAPYLLSDLRSYLMINDEASHLSIKMATEDVRGK